VTVSNKCLKESALYQQPLHLFTMEKVDLTVCWIPFCFGNNGIYLLSALALPLDYVEYCTITRDDDILAEFPGRCLEDFSTSVMISLNQL
jgi:hypothetical protein